MTKDAHICSYTVLTLPKQITYFVHIFSSVKPNNWYCLPHTIKKGLSLFIQNSQPVFAVIYHHSTSYWTQNKAIHFCLFLWGFKIPSH